jgi:hypothetical protein
MPDKTPAKVTLGSSHTRGGTSAAAADAVQAVTRGIEAGAGQNGMARSSGHVDLSRLRLRLPAGASAQDISRSLERAIARAVKERS